jgi:hypothetical protein
VWFDLSVDFIFRHREPGPDELELGAYYVYRAVPECSRGAG